MSDSEREKEMAAKIDKEYVFRTKEEQEAIAMEKVLDAAIEKDWAETKEYIFGTKEEQAAFAADGKKFAQREYERAIKAGGATRELAVAGKIAKSGIESDGLMPTKSEYGEWTYTAEQGAMAACLAREDAATTLILQTMSLTHLHGIKRLLWVCVCLLAYIAYKVF